MLVTPDMSNQQPTDIQSIFKPLLFSTASVLGAGATYTTPTINTTDFTVGGGKTSFGRVTGRVFAIVAGNVFMDVSDDGIAWDQVWTSAVAANGVVEIDRVVSCKYSQFRYVNGPAAQTGPGFRFSGYGRPQ